VLLQRSSDEYSCDKEKESPRFQLPNYHELKKKKSKLIQKNGDQTVK
jgi:hypothetical protein